MAEEKFDIQKAYKKLKETYKLPDFHQLDTEFEIRFIDKEEFLIRRIRRRINEKVIFFCRIIEGVLFPQNASYITSVETRVFGDKEKQDYLKMYRNLMKFERRSLLLDTECDDDKDAKFIKEVTKSWPEFKRSMEEFIKKLEKAWEEEDRSSAEGFFG